MDKIIKKGLKLPLKIVKKNYSPAGDCSPSSSSSLEIKVFEGENRFVKDNYSLCSFKIMNLPHKKKEDIHVEITFELDENEVLTVTGKIKEIIVKIQ